MALWKDPTKSASNTPFPPPDATPPAAKSDLPPFLAEQTKADLTAVPRAPAPAPVREKAKSDSPDIGSILGGILGGLK